MCRNAQGRVKLPISTFRTEVKSLLCLAQVCELHFREGDFIAKLSHFDAESGKTVTFDSERVRLVPDAIPSIFPNCPSHLSTSRTRRESPVSKRARMENGALSRAMKDSICTKRSEEKKNAVSSLADLRGKLPAACSSEFWTIKANDRCVMFLRIEDNPSPHVRFSVMVSADLSVAFLAGMTKLVSLPCGGTFPDAVRDVRTLSSLLQQLENHMTETPGVHRKQRQCCSVLAPYCMNSLKSITRQNTVLCFAY